MIIKKQFLPSNVIIPSYNTKLENNNEATFPLYSNSTDDDKTDAGNNKNCEVIHIGFVCTGHKPVLYLMTTLKSLFFYRTNPLHFHIMVNKFSNNTLQTLFDTWDVPDGNFYV